MQDGAFDNVKMAMVNLGRFSSHVHNGGVSGNIIGKPFSNGEDTFWEYNFSIGVGNFAANSNTVINLQDPKMVDQMIEALQNLKKHMSENKPASY